MNKPESSLRKGGSLFRAFTVFYFLLLAAIVTYITLYTADRFVSNSVFNITQQTSSGVDAGLLEIALPGLVDAQSQDSQIAISFISSADLLLDLEQEFKLEEHYSKPDHDLLFSLSEGSPVEDRLDYYRSRISAHFSAETGLTEISVEAFEPSLAKEIAVYLLEETEDYINQINQEVADRQLDFLESELDKASVELDKAVDEFTKLQNEYSLVTPEQTIASTLEIIQAMKLKLLDLKVRYATVIRDSPDSPVIDTMISQIKSLEEQIQQEEAKLSGPEKNNLNQLTAAFSKATHRLEFRTKMFAGAELMLEKTKTEASSKSRFFSVIQKPFMPEKATLPRRWYSSITVVVLGFLLFQIINIIYRSVIERG